MESSLPFRPRSLADRAFRNVETQTARVRERVNRFALQRLIYLGGGALLLAFSALVPLAFVLRGRSWAALWWLAVTALASFAVAVTRRVRRDWIRRKEAALVIDRRAELEDRLATLSALGGEPPASRLWGFLLHENLRLLPRWEPARIQARAVPRSVWFFLASLVFAALTLVSHPGLLGGAGPLPTSGGGQNPIAGSVPANAGADETAGIEKGSVLAELPERIREAIVQSDSPRAGERDGSPRDGAAESGGASIAMNRSDRRSGDAKSRTGSERGRQSDGKGDGSSRSASAKAPKPGEGDPRRSPEVSAELPSTKPARGEGPKPLGRVEVGKSPDAASRNSASAGQQPGGSGAGAGHGGDPTGLYGERDGRGGAAGSFALDLDAMQNRRPSKDGDDSGDAIRPSTRLANEQRLDDAIRRAQVPAEYEKIVQRIFNRADDGGDEAAKP